MAELTPDIVDQVVSTCTEGSEEAAEALGRALDAEVSVAVGEPGTIESGQMPEDVAGPGLVVTFTVGESGAALLLGESSGLLPQWYSAPDPTGQSKLSTLALELGMILLPEDTAPDSTTAIAVSDLTEALQRGKVGDGAAMVPLDLSFGDKQAVARLVWPLHDLAGMADPPQDEPQTAESTATESTATESTAAESTATESTSPEPEATKEEAEPKSEAEPEAKPEAKPAAKPQPVAKQPVRLEGLPGYSRSLLKIKVPVVVTLAEKRQSLGQVVELGPGSIIQFEKSCEEMLELNVGSQPVAVGEAVKVGDKFGLRVTQIILPEERFAKVTTQ
jgi:flagellar motor switch protein FliN/FliY